MMNLGMEFQPNPERKTSGPLSPNSKANAPPDYLLLSSNIIV